MLFKSYFSEYPDQGVYPLSISYIITPIANTYESMEKSKFIKLSGAMYSGDPALTLVNLLFYKLTAKPKSAMIGSPFLKKIFSGFKSRWIIFLLYR